MVMEHNEVIIEGVGDYPMPKVMQRQPRLYKNEARLTNVSAKITPRQSARLDQLVRQANDTQGDPWVHSRASIIGLLIDEAYFRVSC
jgi:hypothetical protein